MCSSIVVGDNGHRQASTIRIVSVSSALIVAAVAGVVALASAGIAAWAQMRVFALEQAAHAEESRSQARVVLDRYRGPLLDAAWDLGDRVDNIIDRGFFDTYGTGERHPMAIQTTLFRMAQYFGWVEIVRREVQLLRFESASDTRRTAYFLSLVMRRFATDWYDSCAAYEQARAWIADFDCAQLPARHLMLWHGDGAAAGPDGAEASRLHTQTGSRRVFLGSDSKRMPSATSSARRSSGTAALHVSAESARRRPREGFTREAAVRAGSYRSPALAGSTDAGWRWTVLMISLRRSLRGKCW